MEMHDLIYTCFPIYVNYLEKLPKYNCYLYIIYNSDFLLLREMVNSEVSYKKVNNGCPLDLSLQCSWFFAFIPVLLYLH